jgi:hypothetical protein
MAMMSTMNDIRMFGALRRNAAPDLMDSQPGFGASPSGTMRGRVTMPRNPAAKSSTSTE